MILGKPLVRFHSSGLAASLSNGELLVGIFILVGATGMASGGDFLLGTVVLHDPDDALLKQAPDLIEASRP